MGKTVGIGHLDFLFFDINEMAEVKCKIVEWGSDFICEYCTETSVMIKNKK